MHHVSSGGNVNKFEINAIKHYHPYDLGEAAKNMRKITSVDEMDSE